jgi:hypothetical protein
MNCIRNPKRISRGYGTAVFIFALASESFLVLALLPKLRGIAREWWRCVVKQLVKSRVVHINVDLGEAGGITVSCIGKRRIEGYRLFFTTG